MEIVEDDIAIQYLIYDVKLCEVNGIKVDRAELLSLSIDSEKRDPLEASKSHRLY